LPQFWRNRFYKFFIGIVLIGLCRISLAQIEPLSVPEKVNYPGIIETFEKLIEIDTEKNQQKIKILTEKFITFPELSEIKNLEIDPDFLNSIILHSNPGYLRISMTDKCRFYEGIITDLLKNTNGNIQNIIYNYSLSGTRQSAIINRGDLLKKIIPIECPEIQKKIAAFQIKTLSETISGLDWNNPKGIEECRTTHSKWITHSMTPFLCQIHEYLKYKNFSFKIQKNSSQTKSLVTVLEKKITSQQKRYLNILCENLDDEEIFCEELINVSFWEQISSGLENKSYSDDICRKVTNLQTISEDNYQHCLNRLKKEPDLCLYPAGRNSGLRPQPDCDQLSTALNFSSFKNNFNDCSGESDQMGVTNISRILFHFGFSTIKIPNLPCNANSASLFYEFNKLYDNEENWKVDACYVDPITRKDVCLKTFFSDSKGGNSSYSSVVSEILKKTRGMDQNITCELISNNDYNPLLLRFKSGCFIIFEEGHCKITNCKHKIILNDRSIDFIKIKGIGNFSYFPENMEEERFSQTYILNNDFKKKTFKMDDLPDIRKFLKKSTNGIIHGVGCAEDLLPTFFKSYSLNQCSPLPFIINGMLKNKDESKVVFITRTAADSLKAPRLISWSSIFSSVKNYQRKHPMKVWTLHGLD
jgi:hypothetical protein